MTTKDITILFDTTLNRISKGYLAESFFLINKMLKALNNWQMSEKLHTYADIYQNMLKYNIVSSDKSVTQDDEIYNQLIFDLLALLIKAKTDLMTIESNSLEYEGRRLMQNRPQTFLNDTVEDYNQLLPLLKVLNIPSTENNQLLGKYQKIMSPLFAYTLLHNSVSDEILNHIKAIINAEEVSMSARCLTITALTMNILCAFCSQKFNILLSLSTHTDIMIRQRALVGIILIIAKYSKIIKYDSHTCNRLLFLSRNSNFIIESKNILFQLIRTTETSELTKQINSEIMPELMKISPMIKDKLDELDYDEDGDTIKPKFENILDKMNVSDKVKEFMELQMSGSDVFAATFAQMKQTPFFNFIENWFIPFDRENPYISQLFDKREKLAKVVENNPMLCNSDKYSMMLNLLQMPDNQISHMEYAMLEEKSQMDEMLREINNKDNWSEEKTTANHYILDLYRFYEFFPRKKEVDNPILHIKNLPSNEVFSIIFDKNEDRKDIANFFYQYNHYQEAISIYHTLLQTGNTDLEVCRNLAYSCQQTKDYQNAINYYILADTLDNNKTWYLRRLAFCYRKSGNVSKAIDCLKSVMESTKEDYKVMFRLALSYIETHQYESALELLYKIEYYRPEYPNIKSWILQTLFYCGKIEQAKTFVEKYISDQSEIHEYITAGHIYLINSEYQRAIELYKSAITKSKDMKSFHSAFFKDKHFLNTKNIDSATLNMIMELVVMNRFL